MATKTVTTGSPASPFQKIQMELSRWSWRYGLGSAGCASAAVAAGEFLHASCRIHEFLFTRVERVAGCADADLQAATGGAGVINLPTGTGNGGVYVVWMNLCFHGLGKGCKR